MSFEEMAVLALVGLVVLGPRELARVARQLGGWVGRARRTTMELRRQLEREIALGERAASRPDSASAAPKADASPPTELGQGSDAREGSDGAPA